MGIVENAYRIVIANQNGNYGLSDIGLQSALMSTPNAIFPSSINVNSVTATGKEWAEFINFYYKKFVLRFSTGFLRDIMDSYFPVASIGFLYAKQNLGGLTFGTYGVSGQFGATPISPAIAYSGLSGLSGFSEPETWDVSVSAGWQTPSTSSGTPAGAFYVNLNTNNTSIPALQLYNNSSVTVFGVLDQTNPAIIEGVQAYSSSGNKLGVEYDPLIGFSSDQTVSFLQFSRSFILGQSDSLKVDVDYNRSGNARPVLLGIAFLKNTILTNE
ncbi:MAG: hypothetical protein QW578_05720 [Thermoplasmatales archaeon]